MKLRRFIRFTLRALLLLLICLAGIVVGIQTAWAKRVICSFLSDKLSTAAGLDVQIRDLSGVLPLTATIGHVSVADAEGIWLEIRSIDFRWTPLRLLKGELCIRRLVVDEALLARTPSRPAVESRSKAAERSEMALVPLHIEQAALRRLVLAEDVLRAPVEIKVGANGFLFTQNDHLEMEATYVVGTHPESAATVVWRGSENHPALDMQVGIPTTPYLEQPGHLSATLVPREGEWEARLDLRIADADFVSTHLTGSTARASAVLEVHRTTKLPLELAATIAFEQSAGRKEVTVTRLEGGYSEIPFRLLEPLQLTIENDGVSIPSLAAQVKGQVLEGEALIQEEQLNARIACKQVDSSILGEVPASWEKLSLEVLASGSPAQPRVEATGALSGFRFHHPHSEGHPPLVADVRAILEGTELKADLEARANDRFQVAVETRFPAALSFRPFTFALDARNPEYLSTAGHLDLSLFNEMPIHGSMQVSGQLVADLEFDGKTGSIRARGPTRITDGRFEEAVLGTVLEDINEDNPALDVQLGIPATPYLEQPGHLSATLVPREGEWEARLDLRIADADFVSTHLTGSTARASAVLEVHRTTKLPLELAATIAFEQSAGRKEVTVTRLEGGYSEIPFRLLEPLQLTIENDGVSIPSLAAQVKGQVLEGEALIQEEQLNARIACKQVDSSILGEVPASWEKLSLEVLASGSPAQPRVEATGALSGFRFHHPHSEGHPPLVADVRAILEGTELKADLEARANDRFQVAVETRFPAALSFRPFTFALDARNPEYLSTAGHLDLSLFNEMPIHGSMQVSGQLVADLEFDGKTGSIRARGPTRITDGRFEEAVLGTVLEDINAEMGVETDRLVLKEVSARAGEGSVLLGGAFQLPSATGTPMRISAEMQNALLLNRDDVRASVSGLAELTYREGGMDLSGSLTVDSGEIRVDHLPGGSAESFEVVEVGGNRPVSEEATTATQTKSGVPLSGQLDIAIPGPFRVRGRDIDTSWRGDLTASREQEVWSVNGRLNTQRGRVTFLSRTFVLDSGTLYLGGNVPPIPVVDITARHQRASITAIAHLRGPVQDPIIQLSSVPALPQDEIFSHVLFGRSMSDMTTLQAVTLANTIRSQTTGRRRSDSMQSRVRDRLGVDLVGLQESRTEEGETEVLLGRQFSSSTYVEFNSSLGSSGSGIRVEYEITPRLSIETESGTRMRPGFGVNWRYNY